MNNGYSGTGISIIFYLLLAISMPIIHFLRIVSRHNLYKHRFVLRHFLYGIMIILVVVIGISWLITVTGIKERAHWHVMLNVSAATTVGLLLVWILLPLMVRFFLWLFYVKPAATLQVLPTKDKKPPLHGHDEHRVIDSMMSRDQWIAFRTIHYGVPRSRKYISKRQINYLR